MAKLGPLKTVRVRPSNAVNAVTDRAGNGCGR